MDGGVLENNVDGGGVQKTACGVDGDSDVASVIVELSVTLGNASNETGDVAIEDRCTKGLRVQGWLDSGSDGGRGILISGSVKS